MNGAAVSCIPTDEVARGGAALLRTVGADAKLWGPWAFTGLELLLQP